MKNSRGALAALRNDWQVWKIESQQKVISEVDLGEAIKCITTCKEDHAKSICK